MWLVPALLVAVNVVWLVGLRATVLGRGSVLARQREATAAEVASLKAQRDRLVAAREALGVLESDLGTLRKDRLGSMRERLVSFLVDVAKRTHAAGLQPERVTYRAESDKKTGMVHFSAAFAVSGTYDQVRRCVNLLESSPQFVIVERLAARTEDAATSLDVDVLLSVGTYFVDADTGMLRQLGIEDLPRVAAAAPPSPEVAAAPAAPATAEPPRTDFTAVDAAVMEDLAAAVAGLTDGESDAGGDLFVTPEPEPPPRRERGKSIGGPRSRTDSFMSRAGRREVSGGG
jgi:Tfp pilus assembly protein PilO